MILSLPSPSPRRRGNGASVLRLLPEAALKFAIFDQYQVLFAPRDKDQNEAWNTVLKTGLGISTALFTTATVRPTMLASPPPMPQKDVG